MTQSLDWLDRAICKGKTSLFFTSQDRETKKDKERRELIALTYCAQCPVQLPCREYGRENNELGIWGGETEDMRWKAGYLRVNVMASRRKFVRREQKERQRNLERQNEVSQ